jgi:HD-like signal output (HDOD) protein
VFIAGLLHDLGLLVLATHYPREYRAIREAAAEENKPLDDVEDAVMEIDHGMIGEILAAHRMLPRPACAAIGPESLAVILAEAQVQAEQAAELIGFGR